MDSDGFIDAGTLGLSVASSNASGPDDFHTPPSDAGQSAQRYSTAKFEESTGYPSAAAFIEGKLADQKQGRPSTTAVEQQSQDEVLPSATPQPDEEGGATEAFEALFVADGASSSSLASKAAESATLEDRLPNPSSLEDAAAILAGRPDLSRARAGLPASLRSMMEEGIRAVTSAPGDALAAMGLVDAATSSVGGAAGGGTQKPWHAAANESMVIASAQIHPVPGDVSANVKLVCRLLEAAASSLVDLLVFPETFLQGYHVGGLLMKELAITLPSSEELAEFLASTSPNIGPSSAVGEGSNPILHLCAASKATGVSLCIPFAERAKDSSASADSDGFVVFDSTLLIDGADGRIKQHYRKTHLWRFNGYEGSLFNAGPGDRSPYQYAPTKGTSVQDPFWPVTLTKFPHIPIGLCVCFDIEFPEPARRYALRGAKVVLASMASGDTEGFSSERIVPTRAAENHCVVVYANFPSSPLPPMPEAVQAKLEALRGRRLSSGNLSSAPLPAIATEPLPRDKVAYAGSTTICDPKGRFLVKMPAYVCTRNKDERARRVAKRLLVIDDHDHGESDGKRQQHVLATDEGLGSLEASHEYFMLEQSKALTDAVRHKETSGTPTERGADEVVLVARLNLNDPSYLSDEERNPYLYEVRKRSDIYG